MKILYVGDSPVGGAANYLLGILRLLKATVRHLPPSATLEPSALASRYHVVILSDVPRQHVPIPAQEAIARQVARGTGLLMIGGWASFSGPCGGWRGSVIESLLPVRCLTRDDRRQFPAGALVVVTRRHGMFRPHLFASPPSICGLNEVRPKPRSLVLLSARRIVSRVSRTTRSFSLSLDPHEYPVLAIDVNPQRRIAALTTDVAPHWCGGLVDWGSTRVRLPVRDGMQIEVGNDYVRFVAALIGWLGRAEHVDAR